MDEFELAAVSERGQERGLGMWALLAFDEVARPRSAPGWAFSTAVLRWPAAPHTLVVAIVGVQGGDQRPSINGASRQPDEVCRGQAG
jgi:hypothetical protein